MKYVLIMPARNEADYIEKTIASVIGQTKLPERFVIVNDASTDRTGEMARAAAARFPWIEVIDCPPRDERSFAGKVHAFNAGLARLRDVPYEIVGNLDADISFEPDYFEFLLRKFEEMPRLGVAGTAMREEAYDALTDSFYHIHDVFGACQLFRRTCFEEVGGYTPVKWGGIDWIAVRMARYRGWETRSFLEKTFFHHRPMGATETNIWKARFDYGRKDYFLGNHPLWQVFRVAFQMLKRPYAIGGLILLYGYVHSLIMRVERPVPPELLRFHRREQVQRLKALLGRFFKTGHLNQHSRT